MEHSIIEPLSKHWYIGILISIVFSFLLYYTFSKTNLKKYDKKIGYTLFLLFFFNQLYLIINSNWTLQDSIPLHLCNLSYIMSCLSLIYKKQFYFEWVLYFGIVS